jgi:hypothetical protein
MRVRSISRVKTRPGLHASALRISNSTYVAWTSSSRTFTVRLAKSTRSSLTLELLVGDVGAGCARSQVERRSAALTRERNSRSENGLVM